MVKTLFCECWNYLPMIVNFFLFIYIYKKNTIDNFWKLFFFSNLRTSCKVVIYLPVDISQLQIRVQLEFQCIYIFTHKYLQYFSIRLFMITMISFLGFHFPPLTLVSSLLQATGSWTSSLAATLWQRWRPCKAKASRPRWLVWVSQLRINMSAALVYVHVTLPIFLSSGHSGVSVTVGCKARSILVMETSDVISYSHIYKQNTDI